MGPEHAVSAEEDVLPELADIEPPASTNRIAGGVSEIKPPHLPLLRLDLAFTIDEPVELPPFRGNLWRGVLGPALKRIDEGLLPGLDTGALAPGTLYRTFFQSPPPPDAMRMRLYDAVPHPYVIDAPGAFGVRRLDPGTVERVGLTLVGRAATAVEAVLAAFDFAARAGLGSPLGADRERGRARLSEARAVWRGDAGEAIVFDDAAGLRPIAAEVPPVPACPRHLRMLLATPLRLLRDNRLVRPRQFEAGALIANLVRRTSMVSNFFGEGPLDTDFRALKTMWQGLSAQDAQLAVAGHHRWSSAQERELDMSGLVGSFCLDLAGREALFPYLWLGQWLHAGKGTVMGLGAIRLRPE